jgi:hypothetical protein
MQASLIGRTLGPSSHRISAPKSSNTRLQRKHPFITLPSLPSPPSSATNTTSRIYAMSPRPWLSTSTITLMLTTTTTLSLKPVAPTCATALSGWRARSGHFMALRMPFAGSQATQDIRDRLPWSAEAVNTKSDNQAIQIRARAHPRTFRYRLPVYAFRSTPTVGEKRPRAKAN